MREKTEFKDKNNKIIYEGDILLNDFVGDLWIVERINNNYYACLIPNSGIIGHPDDYYPYYKVELEDIAEVFEIIDNRYDNEEYSQYKIK